ncbi:MAG: hypothetical protein EOO05_18025 [Chitinophagaceae bacterium]|nr:MAG: hypothetical protein EOO05_18025 [Chitinophagaceae bacterium]
MKKILLIPFILFVIPGFAIAQKQPVGQSLTISADSARRNMVELLDELSRKHPGFYRYNSKPAFKAFIDSTLATISTPLDELGFYRKLKLIIARIRCVHTTLSLSEDQVRKLNGSANMLPVDVFFQGDRTFITANYSAATPP